MFLKHDTLESKKVFELISSDFKYAKALDSFGIDFFKYYNFTIGELCAKKGISSSSLFGYRVAMDESFDLDIDTLQSTPLNLLIEYLKHNHGYFIKNKLPYIKNLIANLTIEDKKFKFFNDLKFIFPLFYEDFVDHILEEEKHVFTFIQALYYVHDDYRSHVKLFFDMKKISLKEIAKEHLEEDSEMSGIRGLTNNYSIKNIDNLHLKVIYQELESFDRDLELHSKIENEIMFPRAIALQDKISDKIRNISFLN